MVGAGGGNRTPDIQLGNDPGEGSITSLYVSRTLKRLEISVRDVACGFACSLQVSSRAALYWPGTRTVVRFATDETERARH